TPPSTSQRPQNLQRLLAPPCSRIDVPEPGTEPDGIGAKPRLLGVREPAGLLERNPLDVIRAQEGRLDRDELIGDRERFRVATAERLDLPDPVEESGRHGLDGQRAPP